MAVRGARVISVIIPAFNEERALPQTLRALFTQLGDYEVIIIDGGSHDRTIEIIRSFQDVQFFAAPKGRASQMNAGAKEARANGCSFFMPTRFCRLVQFSGSMRWKRTGPSKPVGSCTGSPAMIGGSS
jgi:glycosyltransferase involved in cell wall biosynthesis